MIGQWVVLVEVFVDCGPRSLCMAAIFPPPPEDAGRAEWWAAYHRGLDAAVKRVWRPEWHWMGTEANFAPYKIGVANAERVTSHMVAPMDSADRWTVDDGPENALAFSGRFGLHIEGGRNGQA